MKKRNKTAVLQQRIISASNLKIDDKAAVVNAQIGTVNRKTRRAMAKITKKN